MDTGTKKVLTRIEVGFNKAGCIPGVALCSGTMRALLGKAQAITGIALNIIGFLGSLVSNQHKWTKMQKLGTEFALHGALNFIRGLGEALISATTFIGNLFLLIPNLEQHNKFRPFIPYGMLTEESNCYNTAPL